jgi:hypothetical protein
MAISRSEPLRLHVIIALVPTRQHPDFGVVNARQLGLLVRRGVDVRMVI